MHWQRPAAAHWPSTLAVQDALRFTEEIAQLCERHCPALRDFTGAPPARWPAGLMLGRLACCLDDLPSLLHASHCTHVSLLMPCPVWLRVCVCCAGEGGEALALDIGCAVGGASFELARAFPHVLGIDFSQHFVNAANVRTAARMPCFGLHCCICPALPGGRSGPSSCRSVGVWCSLQLPCPALPVAYPCPTAACAADDA